MNVINHKYEAQCPVSTIRPHERNAREADSGAIHQSIEANGFYGALVVQLSSRKILAGNHRYLTAVSAGAATVPVIWVDVDDKAALRILLADNRTGDLASYDMSALADLLDSVRMDIGFEGTGWDDESFQNVLDDLEGLKLGDLSGETPATQKKPDPDVVQPQVFGGDTPNSSAQVDDAPAPAAPVVNIIKSGLTDADESPEPEPEVIPTSQPGDLWILGEHRVLCGDSTSAADVQLLLNGELADLVVTDPPYNVAYQGKTADALTIQNDSMSASSFYEFLHAVYTNYFSVLKEGCPIYVFHADTEGVNFRKAMTDAGFKLAQCLVWVKNSLVMGRQDYHWKHEPILYGWKPGAAHKWYTDRKQTTVWNFDRPSRNGEHPTMKPIALVQYPIGNSSQPGDLVLDFFGGSGSTLIASETLSRRCFTIELDPKYVDVIVKRWQAFSGKAAVLDGNGQLFADLEAERAAERAAPSVS